jgi:hypothetical protein
MANAKRYLSGDGTATFHAGGKSGDSDLSAF